MNKLSCLEHLSTLSLSTEMSEIMLHRKKAQVEHSWAPPHNKRPDQDSELHTKCWRTWACSRVCRSDSEGFEAPVAERLDPQSERRTTVAPGMSWAVLSACWLSGNLLSPTRVEITSHFKFTMNNWTWKWIKIQYNVLCTTRSSSLSHLILGQ